jgi:hypothetical protein
MSDQLSSKEEAILKRAMGRFRTRLALIRMGIPLRHDHPVSDSEYQEALERPECEAKKIDQLARAGCTCPYYQGRVGNHVAGCPAQGESADE